MTKIILLFIVSFLFVNFVGAVAQPKGEVPVLLPIQSPPEGMSPNFNKNIQNEDPNYPISEQAKPETVIGHDDTEYDGTTGEVTYKKSSSWVWWLGIGLVLVLIGWWVKRNSKNL